MSDDKELEKNTGVDHNREGLLFLAQKECAPEDLGPVAEILGTPLSQIEALLAAELQAEEIAASEKPEVIERRTTDVRGMLSSMTMAERLKAAMGGNAVVRRLLVQDPSRLVQECVLNNPKLGLQEIEDFAKNPSIDGQVLRSIAGRSHWMRSYRLKVNMTMNPKCPPDLSLKWLRFLHENEIKGIARSKNVPQVLQVAAKKKLQEKGG